MNPSTLKAMSFLVAKNDSRKFLNYILMEVTDDRARLVATDGKVAGIYQLDLAAGGYPPGRWLIDPALIKPVKVTQRAPEVTFEALDDERLILHQGDTQILLPQPDGLASGYPNIDLIVHDQLEADPTPAFFIPEQYHLFGRVAKALHRSSHSVKVHARGDLAAPVTISSTPEFLGFIMPVRHNDSDLRPTLKNAGYAREGDQK